MSKFIHTITRVRKTHTGALDEYGQPVESTPDETDFKGLVQPQGAREGTDSRSGAAEIADHVIFTPVMDLSHTDALVYGDDRFEILGIRRFEFGHLAHFEVTARRVSGAVVGTEGALPDGS